MCVPLHVGLLASSLLVPLTLNMCVHSQIAERLSAIEQETFEAVQQRVTHGQLSSPGSFEAVGETRCPLDRSPSDRAHLKGNQAADSLLREFFPQKVICLSTS